jgi:hypothetical protein
MTANSNAKNGILGKDLQSYCRGLIETGFSRLPEEATYINNELLPNQGSIQEHTRLLKLSQQVLMRLIEDKRI